MCKLLKNNAKFVFDKACLKAFEHLNEKSYMPQWLWLLAGLNCLGWCVMHMGCLWELFYVKDVETYSQFIKLEKYLREHKSYTVTEQKLLAVVYAFGKYRSYFSVTSVIFHTNHAALWYLMTKKDAKPRLIQ